MLSLAPEDRPTAAQAHQTLELLQPEMLARFVQAEALADAEAVGRAAAKARQMGQLGASHGRVQDGEPTKAGEDLGGAMANEAGGAGVVPEHEGPAYDGWEKAAKPSAVAPAAAATGVPRDEVLAAAAADALPAAADAQAAATGAAEAELLSITLAVAQATARGVAQEDAVAAAVRVAAEAAGAVVLLRQVVASGADAGEALLGQGSSSSAVAVAGTAAATQKDPAAGLLVTTAPSSTATAGRQESSQAAGSTSGAGAKGCLSTWQESRQGSCSVFSIAQEAVQLLPQQQGKRAQVQQVQIEAQAQEQQQEKEQEGREQESNDALGHSFGCGRTAMGVEAPRRGGRRAAASRPAGVATSADQGPPMRETCLSAAARKAREQREEQQREEQDRHQQEHQPQQDEGGTIGRGKGKNLPRSCTKGKK
jgi:hypothetical protein